MNEEQSVRISADQGLESIGKSPYLAIRDGDFEKRQRRSSVLVAFGMFCGIAAVMMFTTETSKIEKRGRLMPSPSLDRGESVVGPKLMTERDLVNVIKRPRVDSSALGKIRVVRLRSISLIPVGSEMAATLESGATDGIVKAKLTRPLIVDGEPIVPEGAVLFGKGKSGDERLNVEFKKVIFPSGETFSIRAQAFDASDKIFGLKGAIVGRRTQKMVGAMAFGFLGGMADGLQDTSGSSVFSGKRPSVRDSALSGASKAALDQSQLYLDELKKSPNVIEVKAGTAIVVITDEPKPKEEHYETK